MFSAIRRAKETTVSSTAYAKEPLGPFCGVRLSVVLIYFCNWILIVVRTQDYPDQQLCGQPCSLNQQAPCYHSGQHYTKQQIQALNSVIDPPLYYNHQLMNLFFNKGMGT